MLKSWKTQAIRDSAFYPPGRYQIPKANLDKCDVGEYPAQRKGVQLAETRIAPKKVGIGRSADPVLGVRDLVPCVDDMAAVARCKGSNADIRNCFSRRRSHSSMVCRSRRPVGGAQRVASAVTLHADDWR